MNKRRRRHKMTTNHDEGKILGTHKANKKGDVNKPKPKSPGYLHRVLSSPPQPLQPLLPSRQQASSSVWPACPEEMVTGDRGDTNGEKTRNEGVYQRGCGGIGGAKRRHSVKPLQKASARDNHNGNPEEIDSHAKKHRHGKW